MKKIDKLIVFDAGEHTSCWICVEIGKIEKNHKVIFAFQTKFKCYRKACEPKWKKSINLADDKW